MWKHKLTNYGKEMERLRILLKDLEFFEEEIDQESGNEPDEEICSSENKGEFEQNDEHYENYY